MLYRALSARDPRFDGVFFVGVTSTGIYCRPICPARTPRRANCRFFGSAAGGRAGALPPLPALSARAGARPGAGRRRPAHRARGRRAPPVRYGCRDGRRDRRPRSAGRALRAELAPAPPHRPQGAGRRADPARADAPAAAREAAAHRDGAARDRGGVRERLREPAPFQRRLPPPLRHAAHAAAPPRRRGRRRDRRRR